MPSTLRQRHRRIRPIEDMEVALVRACLEAPGWLSRIEESRLRYALGLARLTEIRTSDGRDVDLTEDTDVYRERLTEALSPLLLDRKGLVGRAEIAAVLPMVVELARDTRTRLQDRTRTLVAWDEVDREVREKVLVVAAGGGGGVGYVHLGAFHALEERGIVPALISGSSMGAVMGAFRARFRRFDASEVVEVVKGLSWSKLFRPISIRNRYGLPAPLRLYIREGLGRYFLDLDRQTRRIGDMHIPLLVTISGIRRGQLQHEPEWYEQSLELDAVEMARGMGIRRTRQMIRGLWRTLSEFVARPEMLKPLVVGADAVTRQFDILDALGFSSAVPGLIHYDIARDDPRMEALLDEVMEREDLFRLVDGGVVDNVPARAAWRAVQSGVIGRRNALILALDAFAPRLTQPLWMPIQRLAQASVRRNLRYAHVSKVFVRTPSPLDLVPPVPQILKAVRRGREELAYDMPLVERLLAPVPPLD